MAWGIRWGAQGGPPYEVRCPRCQVSFPVETRKCIHCGGAIARSRNVQIEGTTGLPPAPSDFEPIEPEAETPFKSGTPLSQAISESIHGPGPNERELDVEDEQPSVVRRLISSLGGVIWIVLLIAFALARQCNGE